MAAAMNLVDAMKELYRKGEGTDVTLVCQGTRKAAHSSVLIARFSFDIKRCFLIGKFLRSPLLKSKVLRFMDEKREIVCDDCDPEILTVVVEYMYGIDLPPDLGDLSNESR